jgi:hypothetical protein
MEGEVTDAEWDDHIDALYARWVADNEAYAFEDNYEPFEIKELHAKVSQASISYSPKQINRS